MPKLNEETKQQRLSRFHELASEKGEKEAIRILAEEEGRSPGSMRLYLQNQGVIGRKTIARRGDQVNGEGFAVNFGGRNTMEDNRTVEEQMRDLGVTVIKKNGNEQAKNNSKLEPLAVYECKSARRVGKKDPLASISKNSIYMNKAAMELIGKDEKVSHVTIHEDDDGTRYFALVTGDKGMKFYPRKNEGAAQFGHKGLVEFLSKNGVELGRYKVERAKNGLVARKVAEGVE